MYIIDNELNIKNYIKRLGYDVYLIMAELSILATRFFLVTTLFFVIALNMTANEEKQRK